MQRDDLLGDETLQGAAFCSAHTERLDAWLGELYQQAGAPAEGVALVAVGGYGRGEQCPHSDLDLLLLHEPRVDVAELAPQLWYPIWDTGLKLGHVHPHGQRGAKPG